MGELVPVACLVIRALMFVISGVLLMDEGGWEKVFNSRRAKAKAFNPRQAGIVGVSHLQRCA